MSEDMEFMPCIGCGALVAGIDGPTHRYIGASPGCWAVYGEVLARSYSRLGFGDDRMMAVNGYAVQHPGEPSPQSIQSVCSHLIGLYVVLECGYSGKEVLEAVRAAAGGSHRFQWLEPPAYRYGATILDIHRASDPHTHAAAVAVLAEATWAAWWVHQPQIRAWTAELGLRK